MYQSTIYTPLGQIIKLAVAIKPQAKVSQIVGIINSRLKIAVAAPAIDGNANKALIAFLSDILAVKKSDIVITSGHNSRLKILHVPIQAAEKLDVLQLQYNQPS